MRIRSRPPLALVAAALTLPLAAGAVAVPTAAAQATAPDACAQALNPKRQSVYRFKAGNKTLPFGRVVVTATKANPHKYCVKLQFDGRTLKHAWGESGYKRVNGAWVNEGGRGDTGYRTASYTRWFQVPDKYRTDYTFSVQFGGRWYSTISISRYNL